MVFYLTRSDLRIHVLRIQKINLGSVGYPPNFLFYLMTNIFSFFSKSIGVIRLALVVILTISVTAKYIITKKIIWDYLSHSIKDEDNKKAINLISFVAFCMLFLFAIPDYYNAFVVDRYYLGRITPNVWHNSTIIFLMPFSLLLFWKQFKLLVSKSPQTSRLDIFIISFLIILNLLIKPSFFFVYAPITTLFLLKKHKISKSFVYNVLPIVLGMIILFIQYVILYYFEYGVVQTEDSEISISLPFEIWSEFIPPWYIPISIIISLALPLLYFIFYKKTIRNLNVLGCYALSLALMGILISAFVLEDGPRRLHGNFFWQNVVCAYILMLVISMDVLKKGISTGFKGWRIRVLSFVFLAQFISGFFYIFHILSTNSYY